MLSAEGGRRTDFGAPLLVLLVFLRLGCTSFGGPVAHLGYFRAEFVERRRWLGDRAYADLVALCQFLPGPASSQVGMAIGLQRAGILGLVAAWLGFTLPSAVLLFGFALGVSTLGDVSQAGWVLGLKAAAVAVVGHAVLGMAKSLTPDARRATIAVGVLTVVLLVPGPLTMFGAMALAGIAGYGAAQAVPGPLFTFAAFLGAVTTGGPSGLLGASIALLAIFLPSALLVMGVLPFWERLRRAPRVQRVLTGANSGVVGLLAAALYDPVFTAGVTNAASLVVAALAFVALTSWKTPAWAVVLGAAGAGALLL
ncbi:chromate transporter [Citricoccus sp. NR2]|uniref:chromate transporter n=1 Tax=Citricoccus sp. NR2 TaxID=3004095 RepID=UPI0022DDDBFC|nr:chromate transporter [Citricoccus sp. NR2]WBL19854.1 chromate transporter [Citricoccus sp. NR2]